MKPRKEIEDCRHWFEEFQYEPDVADSSSGLLSIWTGRLLQCVCGLLRPCWTSTSGFFIKPCLHSLLYTVSDFYNSLQSKTAEFRTIIPTLTDDISKYQWTVVIAVRGAATESWIINWDIKCFRQIWPFSVHQGNSSEEEDQDEQKEVLILNATERVAFKLFVWRVYLSRCFLCSQGVFLKVYFSRWFL